jgi:PAS domain-containing protein
LAVRDLERKEILMAEPGLAASRIPIDGPRAAPATGQDEVFRLLVEGIRDYAIFVLDPDGMVVTWNPGAEAMKGYLRGHFALCNRLGRTDLGLFASFG